jgi:2-polyprenyl-6-methoxyphenol hydroxylase-like FAD-dependent oxidoreductase
MNERHDVIIVGSGPVGLITALKLARAGVSVVIVDKLPSVMTAPRAVSYLWPSSLVLDDIGVLGEAIDAGVVKNGLEVRRPITGAISRVWLSCLEVEASGPRSTSTSDRTSSRAFLSGIWPGMTMSNCAGTARSPA